MGNALEYLHGNKVVHRDLKVENILLDSKNNVKLIDFGFSNVQLDNRFLCTFCGSPPYAAPELLLGKPYDGTKSDIWSLGVILYIMVTGGFPFPSESIDALKRAVMLCDVKIPYFVSVECADLIRKMLVIDPSKRYTMANVLAHRWIPTAAKGEVEKIPLYTHFEFTSASSSSSPPPIPVICPTISTFIMNNSTFSIEEIMDAVQRADFYHPAYGTYLMLQDKIKACVNSKNELSPSRRDSRGTLRVNSAMDDMPINPARARRDDFSVLSMSPSESHESFNELLGKDRISVLKEVSGIEGHIRRPITVEEQRRHSLCAANAALQFNLNQHNLHNGAMHMMMNMNQISPTNQPLLSFPKIDTPHGLAVPIDGKSYSCSEEFTTNQMPASYFQNAESKESIEEEGQKYLNKFGGKRYTVHGLANTAEVNNSLRHSPYSKTRSSDRRCSWTGIGINQSQIAGLEKKYENTLSGNSPSIQTLQDEFQKLGELSPREIKPLSSIATMKDQSENSSLIQSGGITFPRISITDTANPSCFTEQSDLFGQIENELSHIPVESLLSPNSPIAKSFETELSVDVISLEIENKLRDLQVTYKESRELVDADHPMLRLSVDVGVEIGITKIICSQGHSFVDMAAVGQRSDRQLYVIQEVLQTLKCCDPNGKTE
ncbi:unnamed protein product [Auanema sp. JU1783]|nr:unnamed protein product [Auanema sp. JU1783]